MSGPNMDLFDTNDYSRPDRSLGDLYCPLCDSHMNSDAMWQAHIIGKKHIKNLNKGGDVEKKYTVLLQRCTIQDDIDAIEDVVVGLNHIDEIFRKNATAPIYMCYLCHSNVSMKSLLIEHICSYKHRLAYIKENDPKSYNSLDFSNFSKAALEDLVFGMARTLELRQGRGEVTVKKENEKKEEIFTWSAKREPPPAPPMPPREREDTSSSGLPPQRRCSPTPPRRRSPTPPRRRSPTPPRRRSASPRKRRSPSPRRRRSPSPRRRRSPSPRKRRSPSPRKRRSPSPRKRRSPSPRRRDRSRSVGRRHAKSPEKKSRWEREDKEKTNREKSEKRYRSKSRSSSDDSFDTIRRRTEGAQPSHSNKLDMNSRVPHFDVLHRSPVQRSYRMEGGIVGAPMPTSFMSNQGASNTLTPSPAQRIHGMEMPQMPMPQASFMNNQGPMNALTSNPVQRALGMEMQRMPMPTSFISNQGAMNTPPSRNVPADIELSPNNLSYEHVRRLVMNLPTKQFLEIVYDKLDNILCDSPNDIFILEDLHANILNVLRQRRSLQTQNVYSAASVVPQEIRPQDPRHRSSARVLGPPQPLDDFLAMVRKNGLQPSSHESQNSVRIPGLD